MRREDVKAIFAEATEEQINAVMKLNGADAESFKNRITALETDNAAKDAAFKKLNDEFEQLKTSNATAEDYKKKFEDLQEENRKRDEAAADAARLEKLKERYNAAAVDKDGKPLEWAHDAIRDSYMQRFVEEVQKDENSGRSDADIFNALTKDDGGAFKTASAQTVFGGAGKASGGGSVLDDIYKDNPFYKG